MTDAIVAEKAFFTKARPVARGPRGDHRRPSVLLENNFTQAETQLLDKPDICGRAFRISGRVSVRSLGRRSVVSDGGDWTYIAYFTGYCTA